MTKRILGALCVAAAAAALPASATPQADGIGVTTIAGRWQGPNYMTAARAPDCDGGRCTLTLDIVPCGTGWCGIEVASDNKCGGTALKLDAGEGGGSSTVFKGSLELAQGTEPYVVQAYLVPASGDDKEWLEIQGDTGGEFRVFRRSFPFNAHLVRAGDAICRTEKPVS
jgi:hypothetical protein